MFRAFNPTIDKNVLVLLGAINGVLPVRSKHECDCLRNVVEMVYKTPRDCQWEFLGSAIKDFSAYNISKNDLVQHMGQGVTYGVEHNQLLMCTSSSNGRSSLASPSRILPQARTRTIRTRLRILFPLTTSLPFKPYGDLGYLLSVTVSHYSCVQTSCVRNQLCYVNVWS